MKEVQFEDDIKENNNTFYVTIPKKSARSINLKVGDSVNIIITKVEVSKK